MKINWAKHNSTAYFVVNITCVFYFTLISVTVHLTHLLVDTLVTFSQTIFWDAFSWMKHFVSWWKFHCNLFLRARLTLSSTGSDNGLVPNTRQAIIWSNADLIHWRINSVRWGVGVGVGCGWGGVGVGCGWGGEMSLYKTITLPMALLPLITY